MCSRPHKSRCKDLVRREWVMPTLLPMSADRTDTNENGRAAHDERKATRALRLLRELVERSALDRAVIAGELVISPRLLEKYLDQEREIPLDRQLCVALFAIERIPELRREGHALHGQVMAAMSYTQRATKTHDDYTMPMRGVVKRTRAD
jgi:hypothetical protein